MYLNNNEPKTQLKEIIINSSLEDNQKELWGKLLPNIFDSEAASILSVLEDDPNKSL